MSALIGLDTNDEHCPLVLTRVGNGGGNVSPFHPAATGCPDWSRIATALPGAMIFAVSICFNLLSDGMRSAMDIRN
jgi:hypothetical protein